MNFTKHSDLGYFDGLLRQEGIGYAVVTAIALIGLLVVLPILFYKQKERLVRILFVLPAIFLLLLGFALNEVALESLVKDTQYKNITKVFDVSESTFERKQVQDDYESVLFGVERFTDVQATVTDKKSRVIYDVTFGFKESGEAFIFKNGAVDKEFIENLKK